jgi:hypothetical protein
MNDWRRAASFLMLAAALPLLVGSCAGPTRWQKSGASAEDWDRDEGACRARVRALAEREYRSHASEVGSPIYGSGSTFEKEMAGYDFRRRERALFENCMRAKGYSPDRGTVK